jgi:hypothetical protein
MINSAQSGKRHSRIPLRFIAGEDGRNALDAGYNPARAATKVMGTEGNYP